MRGSAFEIEFVEEEYEWGTFPSKTSYFLDLKLIHVKSFVHYFGYYNCAQRWPIVASIGISR